MTSSRSSACDVGSDVPSGVVTGPQPKKSPPAR